MTCGGSRGVMKLGLLSNSSTNPSVYWTTLLPPLFSGLAQQPGVRTISPPPIAWERRGEWRRVRSELRSCDTLFWAQLGSRPTGAIHLASYLNPRARRANFVLDAWKPSLTKIGIAATLERLDPCFVAYSQATSELQRRFPLAKFVFLPLGAHTDIFYPRKERKSIFAFWMGRRHEPLHRALLAYCEAHGLRYVYSRDGGLSTEELGRLTSSAHYFVATPPDLDNTRRTGGFSPMVMRYFEGLAARGRACSAYCRGAANTRRSCRPTRSARYRRTVRIWPNASTRIEATLTTYEPSTPSANSCASIIPGDGGENRSLITSPMAPQLIFARCRMSPGSAAWSRASTCRRICRMN